MTQVQKDVVVLYAIAGACTAVAVSLAVLGPLQGSKAVGIFIGFYTGSLSVGVLQMARRLGRTWLRWTAVVLSPLGAVVILPFSVAGGGGYFLGGAIGSLLTLAIEQMTRASTLERVRGRGE